MQAVNLLRMVMIRCIGCLCWGRDDITSRTSTLIFRLGDSFA